MKASPDRQEFQPLRDAASAAKQIIKGLLDWTPSGHYAPT
jgi:hypothetical protein